MELVELERMAQRNERMEGETSQMQGGRSNQQLCEDRRSTYKDQYEKTRQEPGKTCRYEQVEKGPFSLQ